MSESEEERGIEEREEDEVGRSRGGRVINNNIIYRKMYIQS